MTNKLKPVLLGGLAIGILSVLPVVSLVNIVCCAWAIGGGILAVYLYLKTNPAVPLQMGEGIMLGALAGLVGGVIYASIYIPLLLFTSLSRQYEQIMRQFGVAEINRGFYVFGALITLLMYTLMAGVGGALGVKLFEKHNTGMTLPPVPPPDFNS